MRGIQIPLTTNLLAAVDQLAARIGVSRTQLIRQALADRLARLEREAFEANLAQGYRMMDAQLRMIAEEMILAQCEAAVGWDWDEHD